MRADLKEPALANLAVSLWNLSLKHGCADQKMRVSYYTFFNLLIALYIVN